MERLAVQSGPPIKIGGKWRPPGKGPHDDVEVRVAYSLRHGDTLCGFLAGVHLTHLCLFEQADGWLVMLKGKRGAERLVAFLKAASYSAALVLAATSLDTNRVPWKKDKPPPKG